MMLLAHAQALEKQATFGPLQCFNCGETEFIEDASGRICEACSVIDERYRVLATEYTTNYTRRYDNNYSRYDYFKKCIQRYQGLQNCNIPDKVYDALYSISDRLEINRSTILKCLKELKCTKQYKNVHRLYYDLTGKRIDDIDYLEHKLIGDYIEFIRVYNTLEVDRKNFLNIQYVLYQLLMRLDHPCDVKNFSLPKTDKSRLFHDEICRRVFDKLGWEIIT